MNTNETPANVPAAGLSVTHGSPLYTERDVMQLDEDGGYYARHVSGMTRHGLHAKWEIAAELAWRDREIDRLRAMAPELRGAVNAVKDALDDEDGVALHDAFAHLGAIAARLANTQAQA